MIYCKEYCPIRLFIGLLLLDVVVDGMKFIWEEEGTNDDGNIDGNTDGDIDVNAVGNMDGTEVGTNDISFETVNVGGNDSKHRVGW